MANKRILIIHTYGIGDMILFTPAIDLLRQHFPDAYIDILCTQAGSFAPVRHRSDIREMITMPLTTKGIISKLFSLRKRRYDISIVTCGGKPWKAELFSFIVGAKIRIGEIVHERFSLYTKPLLRNPVRHRKESNLKLLEGLVPLGAKHISYVLPNLVRDVGADFLAEHHLNDKVLLGVHPGSNRAFAFRRWPKEHFASVVSSLKKKFPSLAVLLFIGPDEKEEGDYIAQNCDVITVSQPSLDHVASILMECDIFFNSDSGLGHIAACNPECYVFSIFGPADPRLTAPGTENCSIITKGLPCQPCNPENKAKSFCCNLECLNELSPEIVINKMIPIIESLYFSKDM